MIFYHAVAQELEVFRHCYRNRLPLLLMFGGPNAIRACLKLGVTSGWWTATHAGGQGNPVLYSLRDDSHVSSLPGPHSIGGEESSGRESGVDHD